MTVDQKARERLRQDQKTRQLASTITQSQEVEATKTREGIVTVLSGFFAKLQQSVSALAEKKIDWPKIFPVSGTVEVKGPIEVTRPDVYKVQGEVDAKITQLPPIEIKNFPTDNQSVPKLVELINLFKGLKFTLPKIFQIKGTVDVDSLPPVEITNFPNMSPDFKALGGAIDDMQRAVTQAVLTQKLPEMPKSFSIKDPVSMKGMADLLEGVEELKKGFNILIKTTQESKGVDGKNPMKVAIVADLPRPAPATNPSVAANGGAAPNVSTQIGFEDALGFLANVSPTTPLPVTTETSDQYNVSDSDTTSDPAYYGFLNLLGAWYILRLTTSTGEFRYANGASDYSTAWTNRASQSYNYYNVVF